MFWDISDPGSDMAGGQIYSPEFSVLVAANIVLNGAHHLVLFDWIHDHAHAVATERVCFMDMLCGLSCLNESWMTCVDQEDIEMTGFKLPGQISHIQKNCKLASSILTVGT